MSDSPIQIKRYPNRRYYSHETSKYISLQEIEELVQAGETIEIRDSQTGDNLTGSVLAQIIMDRHPDKLSLFPSDMLHFILRSNDVMSTFLREYFRHSLTYLNYVQQRRAAATAFLQPAQWIKPWLEGMSPSPSDDATSAAESEPAAMAARLKQLEERLQELESREQ